MNNGTWVIMIHDACGETTCDVYHCKVEAKQDFADTLANDEEASLPDGFSYAAIHRASNQP